jgi:hypothetical protein
MTLVRLLAATCLGAAASLICIGTLPLVGFDTTPGLWLMTTGIAAGLVAIVSAVLAIAVMLPVQAPYSLPDAPYEPLPRPRVYVVRDALPVASYELEAGQ